MSKRIKLKIITNIIFFGVGFFLLLGPYNSGFLGFFMWIGLGVALNEIEDQYILDSEEKTQNEKTNNP